MRRITRYEGLALFIILVAGFVLRVNGNDFGLPYTFHPDEGFEIRRALQLGAGSYDFTRAGKGGYFYLLFVEYGVFFVVAYFLGMVSGAEDFAVLFISDPTWFYLIGRTTTAVIGAATLFLLYRLVSRLVSPVAGLAAAALLCVSPMHVEHSHYITVDVPLTFLLLLSFYLFTYMEPRSGLKPYVWAALAMAGAAMTKLPGILLVLPFFVVHVRNSLAEGIRTISLFFDRRLWMGVLVFVIAFALGNPAAIVSIEGYWEFVLSLMGLGQEANELIAAGGGNVLVEVLEGEGTGGGNFGYYFMALMDSVSWPVLFLSFVGAFYAVGKRQFYLLNLAGFGLMFYGILGASSLESLVYARYVLPITPILAALAGVTIAAALQRFRLSGMDPLPLPGRSFSSLAVLLVPFLILPLRQVVAQNHKFTLPDTRTLAAEWFHENIEENATILLEGHTAQTVDVTVPLKLNSEGLERAIQVFKDNGEKGKAYYFQLDKTRVSSKRYDLQFYSGDSELEWNSGCARNVDLVVIREKALMTSFYDPKAVARFFEAVKTDPQVSLVKSFLPEPGKVTGPKLEIYACDQQATSGRLDSLVLPTD
jgi:hypothetical protein